MDPVINWTFNGTTVNNQNGSLPITFSGAVIETLSPPIMDTAATFYNKCLNLGTKATGQVPVATFIKGPFAEFSIRILFRFSQVFTGKQVLVDCNRLGFRIALFGDGNKVRVSSFIQPGSSAYGFESTEAFDDIHNVTAGTWHTIELIYTGQTLGTFVDFQIVDVHAFPLASSPVFLGNPTAGALCIGGPISAAGSPSTFHFNGEIANFRLHHAIRPPLIDQLNNAKSKSQWFITRKLEIMRPYLNFGKATGPIRQVGVGTQAFYVQPYTSGIIMWHFSAPAAFEMHGLIRARYDGIPDRDSLGYLLSDEVSTGTNGKKNSFSKGGIYWSSKTGAFDVRGQLQTDYEIYGGAKSWGFPLEAAQIISGGVSQRMEDCTWYYATGATRAYEVHGDIRVAYNNIGGSNVWGFPKSNEIAVSVPGKNIRMSEFQECTIYWSPSTGAREVHGDIRQAYLSTGSCTGYLGLPTSNATNIVGTNKKYNTFEHGAIITPGPIFVSEFQLFLAAIDTKEDFSEGLTLGGNDLRLKITVKQGGQIMGGWNERVFILPVDRDAVAGIPCYLLIDPVLRPVLDSPIQLTILVEEVHNVDVTLADRPLGTWTKELDAGNAWGIGEHNGILDSGPFEQVDNIRVTVKPKLPSKQYSEFERWWSDGVHNRGTIGTIPYEYYAAAFSDVDEIPELLDPSDNLTRERYDSWYKSCAKGGNCFGMSLQAIYDRQGIGPYSMPLNRFKEWNMLERDFNMRSMQFNSAAGRSWYAHLARSNLLRNPMQTFLDSRASFAKGDQPVLVFGYTNGTPPASNCHAVLPIKWTQNGSTWIIDCLDPGETGTIHPMTIDVSNPANSTFSYQVSIHQYHTKYPEWWLYYCPFSIYKDPQITDANWVNSEYASRDGGTLLSVGADSEIVSVSDEKGNDVLASSAAVTEKSAKEEELKGLFFEMHQPMNEEVLAASLPSTLLSTGHLQGTEQDFNIVLKGRKENGKLEYRSQVRGTHIAILSSYGLGEEIGIRSRVQGLGSTQSLEMSFALMEGGGEENGREITIILTQKIGLSKDSVRATLTLRILSATTSATNDTTSSTPSTNLNLFMTYTPLLHALSLLPGPATVVSNLTLAITYKINDRRDETKFNISDGAGKECEEIGEGKVNGHGMKEGRGVRIEGDWQVHPKRLFVGRFEAEDVNGEVKKDGTSGGNKKEGERMVMRRIDGI